MTGPEHCLEAERLLKRSRLNDIDYDTAETDRANLAAAQVHATLALAAATAFNDGKNGMFFKTQAKWSEAGAE